MSESIPVIDRFRMSVNETSQEIVSEFKTFNFNQVVDSEDEIITAYARLFASLATHFVSIDDMSKLTIEYIYAKLNIVPHNMNEEADIFIVKSTETEFPYRIIFRETGEHVHKLNAVCNKAIHLIICLSAVKSLEKWC